MVVNNDDVKYQGLLAETVTELQSDEPDLDQLDRRHLDLHAYSSGTKTVFPVHDSYQWRARSHARDHSDAQPRRADSPNDVA